MFCIHISTIFLLADESISRLSFNNNNNDSPSKTKPPQSISNPPPSETKAVEANNPLDNAPTSTTNQKSSIVEISVRPPEKRREKSRTQEKNKRNIASKASGESSRSNLIAGEVIVADKHSTNPNTEPVIVISANIPHRNSKKRNQKPDVSVNCPTVTATSSVVNVKPVAATISTASVPLPLLDSKPQSVNHKHYNKSKDLLMNGINAAAVPDYDEICNLFSQSTNLRLKNRSSGDKMGL